MAIWITIAAGGQRAKTTGTYAHVRDPGVIWLFLGHLALATAAASRPLFIAVPFWTAGNVLLVAVQDAVFLPRIFGEAYREYQRTVPFLIPAPAGFRRFLATVRFIPQPRGSSKTKMKTKKAKT